MLCVKRVGCTLLLLFGALAPAFAQGAAAALLSGTVYDPSHAELPKAHIHIQSPGLERDLESDRGGWFSIELPPGTYVLSVSAAGFQGFERKSVRLGADQHLNVPVVLRIATHEEQVTVALDGNSPTDPANNRTALVFNGAQLAIFSDNDATLQRELTAIAGSVDGAPPQLYVDGFSGGRFPPKTSIREVRINQNPYSAQYDRQGFSRIDILTKPGTEKYHGFFDVLGNDNALNARNPLLYGAAQAPYYSMTYDGNVSGPLGKKTSFFVSGNRLNQQSNSVVNAVVLDGNFAPVALSQAVPSPQTTNTTSARLDRQFASTDTLTLRYEYNGTFVTNGGLSQPIIPALPSQAYNSTILSQTLQAGNTKVLSSKIVSETRFQYIRTRAQQSPVDSSPTVIVQGAFNGGGSGTQVLDDHQDRYEFQEHLSWDRGAHVLRAGARYRLLRDANLSTANYNGEFIFPSLTAYQITQQVLAQPGGSVAKARNTCVTTNMGIVCGGPSQFSLTSGVPSASVSTGDLGLYVEDDWKLRKDLTLSMGFRLESQSAVPDHFDPAPRLGLSWAIHHGNAKRPVLVLRPGLAIFYDRFASTNILQALRLNGVSQQAYFMKDPCFFPVQMACANLTAMPLPVRQPTIYRVDPNLRSQYDMLAAISAEHSFGPRGSVAATYLAYRGLHQYLAVNANAPLPGTVDPSQPGSGTRPLGGTSNIYQYSSSGITKGELFSVNANWNPMKHFFMVGFYAAQKRNTDSGGSSAFVSNSYNVSEDYGRSAFVPSHRMFAGLSTDLPWDFGLSTFVTAHSGLPYNITTGQDLNGDTFYNDRPSFTAGGGYNATPLPSAPEIPINYGHSADYVSLQISLGKSFRVGPKRSSGDGAKTTGKAERPYECGFSIDTQNTLNRVNFGTPVGVLGSPLFGRSVSLADTANNAANRTVTLRTYFSF